jgi:succinyl-diaminopimelate desuccinylase
MSAARETLVRRLEAERDTMVRFLQDFTRIDTCNPPGDTRAGAAFLRAFLDRAGLAYRVIAPEPINPNIIARTDFARPGRHLVLNGHIDVFPIGERARWSRDPLAGDIVDGKVFGRGTVDMKCGTTASLFTYFFLNQVRDALKGALTLTIVSDEETGGRWGSGYLVENHPEVLGDCVLNGEPSSPWTVRFGEKSMIWFKVAIKTPGGHSAYPHLSKSATKIAAEFIRELAALEALAPETPAAVARAMAKPEVRAAIERGLGRGASEVVERLTVNVGTIAGGVKVNMLPSECRMEVDLRLPVGIAVERARAEFERIAARFPEISVEPGVTQPIDATWSDPEHAMIGIVQRNAAARIGVAPPAIVTLGATDCRFWRAKGVPAFVYGCSPDGMGAPDEAVKIDEFLHVVACHTLSAFDYLT